MKNFSTSIKAITFLAFLPGCINLCPTQTAEIRDLSFFEKNGRIEMTAIETNRGDFVVSGDATNHVKGFLWTRTCRGNTVVRFEPDGVGYGAAN